MMTTPKAQVIALLNTQTHHFNGRPINGINARQLHQALGVGRMYAHWIKARIKQGQFIEEMDFILAENADIKNDENLSLPKLASTKTPRSPMARPQKGNEYIISVDMAKHLCLMKRKNARTKRSRIKHERSKPAQGKQINERSAIGAENHGIFKKRPTKRQGNQIIPKSKGCMKINNEGIL